MSTAMAANKSSNGTPLSLNDVWKLLTEIEANTEKLVLDVESLKGSYKGLKDSLLSTKSQVETLVKENNGLKTK